jgi:branched-chain amino acid transport system permease protein
VELFLQTIIDGLLMGGLIVIIGVGFSLCFGVMHIVDFAVGEWVMLGAYAGYMGARYFGHDAMFYLPVIFLIFFALGWMIYPIIFQVVSGKRFNPAIMGLIFTFGLSILMKGGALTVWGYHIQSVPTWLTGKTLYLGPLTVPGLRASGFAFGILLTLLLMAFLYKSKYGNVIRATAQDRDTANLLGADVRKVGSFVYSLYAGITGMSGALIGALFSVHSVMGAKYTMLAFFVVVLAGMGYIPGVIPAAIVLGLLQSFVSVYIGGRYNLAALFLVMYGVLLITPKGIFRRGW